VVRLLVLSGDPMLSRLVRLNLERRRFSVSVCDWAACCDRGQRPASVAAGLVISDLDCPAPDCWQCGPRLRGLFPFHPLLLLAHERPSAPYVQAHRPCEYVQKPFAVDELVGAVQLLLEA
jgi:DNA-binding response OmpR family regulator